MRRNGRLPAEGLVAGIDNRHLLVAIQQLNRLRRFANYDWTLGHARVVISCREHLQILDHLETGVRETAAALLRQHLDAAAKLASHAVVAGSSLIGRRAS